MMADSGPHSGGGEQPHGALVCRTLGCPAAAAPAWPLRGHAGLRRWEVGVHTAWGLALGTTLDLVLPLGDRAIAGLLTDTGV